MTFGPARMLAFVLLWALAAPAWAQSSGAAAARMQELEDEVRRLNGRIEQLEFQLRQIVEDATRRFGDVEFRLTELEGGDVSLLQDPAPLGQPGGATQTASAGPAVAVSERAALDEAVAATNAGEFARGKRLLETFLATYPDSPLYGEAEHWLGEAHYRQSDYRRAAEIFLDNVIARADNPLAPVSFVHLAVSLERLGRHAEACDTLAEARRRFAEDTAAVAQIGEEWTRLACN